MYKYRFSNGNFFNTDKEKQAKLKIAAIVKGHQVRSKTISNNHKTKILGIKTKLQEILNKAKLYAEDPNTSNKTNKQKQFKKQLNEAVRYTKNFKPYDKETVNIFLEYINLVAYKKEIDTIFKIGNSLLRK